MTSTCEANPPGHRGHQGDVGPYVRICPIGHLRLGYACQACAGNGTVNCNDCPDGELAPALLIAAGVFAAMPLAAINADIRGRIGAEATKGRLAGHGLRREGHPFTMRDGKWVENRSSWDGHGVCECDASSPLLHSNRARQAWSREHKGLVRAAVGGKNG